MLLSIFQSVQPPASPPPTKPTCASFTTAYNAIALRQTYTCYGILLVFASISTALLHLTQLRWPTWGTLIHVLLLWGSMVALMQARLKLTTFQRKFEQSLRSDIRATFSRPETSLQLAIYTTLSIILVFSSFVMISQTTIPNRVSTRQQNIHGGSGVQQMNVERLYVFLYACMLGLAFSLDRNFIQRWVIRLQVVQQHPLYLVKASVRSHLKTPACWALGTFCVSYLVYILFSGFFYKLATRFVGIFISVLDTPIVGFRWWDIMLFYRMVTIGSSIVSAWIFVDVVMDAYFNRVEDCISPYSNALECLIDGLRLDKDDGLRERAFVELARLTAKDPTKRKTIYTTTEGRDTPWSLIKTECFSSMDALTARINQEYNVNKKQEKPKSDAPPTTIKGVKQIKLLNANDTVFSQRRPHATGDALDDRTMHVISNLATRASDAIPSPDIHLGQLATTTWNTFLKSRIGKSIASTRLDGKLGQWGHYLCDESRNRKRCLVLGNPLIQVSSIQALSNVVVFSLKEDECGLLQYDIPAILNRFLAFSALIDKYMLTPPPHYLALSDLPDDGLLQAPFQLKLALEDAMLAIKLTFKNHLDDIHVDEKYASSWARLGN